MRVYTELECEERLAGKNRGKPDEAPGLFVEHIHHPSKPYQMLFLARWIALNITFRQPSLLWITEWGVWPSSENWHLYYKLRRMYGDYRLLHEAPGHLFLDFETEDLASFLQVALLNGWGGYLLTQADFVNAFFSHDEFIDFYAENEANLADLQGAIGRDADPATE